MVVKSKATMLKVKGSLAAGLKRRVSGARKHLRGKRSRGAAPVARRCARGAPQVGCFCKPGSWRCQRNIRKVLYMGEKKRPETLVVVFHGVGDDAEGNRQWSEAWAQRFPRSLVVIPQSPCVNFCYQPEDKGKGPLGYDWLPQPGRHDIADKDANVRALQRVTERRLRQLDAWLTRVLRKMSLTDENVVLVGFSQGCVLATLLGIRRNVKAVVAGGGIGTEPVYSGALGKYFGRECWARWEEMIPARPADAEPLRTKFLICCGGADCTVPRKKIAAMLSDFQVNWKVVEGMEHEFPNYWRGQMLAWMKKAICS